MYIEKRVKNLIHREVEVDDLENLVFMYDKIGIRDLKYNQSLAFKIGRKYRSNGTYDLAKKYYRLGLKDFPNSSKLHLEYAQHLYRNDDNMKEALLHTQRSKELNNGSISTNLFLAELLIREVKWEEAELLLNKIEENRFYGLVKQISNVLRLKLRLEKKMNFGEVSESQKVLLLVLLDEVKTIMDTQFSKWEGYHMSSKNGEYNLIRRDLGIVTRDITARYENLEFDN